MSNWLTPNPPHIANTLVTIKMKRYFEIFPNKNGPLGSYNPFTHVITLNCIDQESFESRDINSPSSEDDIRINGYYAHELTHWLDHHTTIWGQLNLIYQYNAMNARLNGRIKDLWRIKHYYDSCKRDCFEDYFATIIDPEYDFSKGKWAPQTSSTPTFDIDGNINPNRPINIITYTSEDNREIAHIPIYTESILEVRALHHEFSFRAAEIKEKYTEPQKSAAFANLNIEIDNLLYDVAMLKYNSIAHFTTMRTNQIKLDNIFESSSLIGNLSLNFPKKLTDRILLFPTENDMQRQHFQQMLLNREAGFIYYNLIMNSKDLDYNSTIDVNAILHKSELPDILEYTKLVISEMKNNLNHLIQGPFYDTAKKRLEKGIEMVEKHGISSLNYLYFQESDESLRPIVRYRDTKATIKEIPEDTWMEKEELNYEEHMSIYLFMLTKIYDFIGACKN